MTSAVLGSSVPAHETEVLPDDHYARDVITLPGTKQELLVNAVLIGQNGFILTVSSAGDDTP